MGLVEAGDGNERCEPYRARVDRWRTSASVLDEVRRTPGLTRVELAGRLGLSSATTTETVARLREIGWLCEQRAPVSGRGRPTTCLRPAAEGPRVLALDLRHEDWRLAVAGLDGVPTVLCSGRRGDDLAERLARAIGAADHRGRRSRSGSPPRRRSPTTCSSAPPSWTGPRWCPTASSRAWGSPRSRCSPATTPPSPVSPRPAPGRPRERGRRCP